MEEHGRRPSPKMTMNPEIENSKEPQPEWFANESFWEELSPYMFRPEKFDAATGEVEKIIALARFQGETVLDLCCGPGRHSIAFARRGYVVTGVDRTPFLLQQATSLAAQENVRVEWIEQDMISFVRNDAFDLVVNLFTAFGYFDDKNDDIQVLKNVLVSLRAGGTFVLYVLGKEQLASKLRTTDCDFHPDGSLLAIKREIFDDWTRIRNEWTLVKGDCVKRFKFHHTIYSAQELRDRFEQVGFKNVEIFGDWDGNSYGPDAKRLIVVGQKI